MNQSHPDQRWGGVSYAQHGDDFMIMSIFEELGIDKPSYLDVGAHHPINISNTYALYLRGSIGVSIDANPNVTHLFAKHRPRDMFLNVGVSPVAGRATFYMLDSLSGLNTFSHDSAQTNWPGGRGLRICTEEKQIDCITLNQVVDTYCGGAFPDFLNIDIEGLDLDVLAQADFSKSRPKLIVVEVRKPDRTLATETLSKQGYFFYCRMGENCFFIDSEYRGVMQ